MLRDCYKFGKKLHNSFGVSLYILTGDQARFHGKPVSLLQIIQSVWLTNRALFKYNIRVFLW